MKHKENKYKSNGEKEKSILDVFLLTSNFGKFKKGEVFEEFYTNGNRFYATSSNLFKEDIKSGHTKILKTKVLKYAPIMLLRKIKKEDSLLWKLHNN